MKFDSSPALILLAAWLHGSWVASPAAALNGDASKKSLDTYGGWSSFEVVTQGDVFGEYRVPGQFDGIGVSSSLEQKTIPHSNPLVCSDKRVYYYL